LDDASKMVGSDTLHRALTDTIQELSGLSEELSDNISVSETGKSALYCACLPT